MNKSITAILFIVTALFLQGCTSLPASLPLSDATKIEDLTQWQMRGKLALITPEERNSASFFWQRNNQYYQSVLTSNLGTTILKVNGSTNDITLTFDGNTYQSDDPEALINELTGWYIPVSQLNRWLVADVNDVDGRVSFNGANQVKMFQPFCVAKCATNIKIIYADYRELNRLELPHKIEIQTRDKMNLTLQTLRLRVSRWE